MASGRSQRPVPSGGLSQTLALALALANGMTFFENVGGTRLLFQTDRFVALALGMKSEHHNVPVTAVACGVLRVEVKTCLRLLALRLWTQVRQGNGKRRIMQKNEGIDSLLFAPRSLGEAKKSRDSRPLCLLAFLSASSGACSCARRNLYVYC